MKGCSRLTLTMLISSSRVNTSEGKSSAGGTEEFDTHCSRNWIFFLAEGKWCTFILIEIHYTTMDFHKPRGDAMDFELLFPVGFRGTEGQLRKSHLQFESGTCERTPNVERKRPDLLSLNI